MLAAYSIYIRQHGEWSGQGRQSEPGTDVGWENPITAAASGSCHDIHLAESLHLCIWGLSTRETNIAAQRELLRESAATQASRCAWAFCWYLAEAVSKPLGGTPRWNCSHWRQSFEKRWAGGAAPGSQRGRWTGGICHLWGRCARWPQHKNECFHTLCHQAEEGDLRDRGREASFCSRQQVNPLPPSLTASPSKVPLCNWYEALVL